MENPNDDPREFAHGDDGGFDGEAPPPGLDTFLRGHSPSRVLSQALTQEHSYPPSTHGPGNDEWLENPTRWVTSCESVCVHIEVGVPKSDPSTQASRFSVQFSSNGGTRTMSFGGPSTLGAQPSRRNSAEPVPTASQ